MHFFNDFILEQSESDKANVRNKALQSEKITHEKILTSIDNSTTSYSENNLESRGSYHFGNYSVKTSEAEISPKDLETFKKIIGDDPFDDAQPFQKDVDNRETTNDKSPFEGDLLDTSINDFSYNGGTDHAQHLDEQKTELAEDQYQVSENLIETSSDTNQIENKIEILTENDDIIDTIAG